MPQLQLDEFVSLIKSIRGVEQIDAVTWPGAIIFEYEREAFAYFGDGVLYHIDEGGMSPYAGGWKGSIDAKIERRIRSRAAA